MVTKPRKSNNAVIDSDSDGKEKEPEKGSYLEGDFLQRIMAKKTTAKPSETTTPTRPFSSATSSPAVIEDRKKKMRVAIAKLKVTILE